MWNSIKALDIKNKFFFYLPDEINCPNDINEYFLQLSKAVEPNNEICNFYQSHLFTDFENKFSFSFIDIDTVYKYLNEIKSNAMGPDNLNIHMLLLCSPKIIQVLVNIFNSSFLDCIFPDAWKISTVLPLPKKANINTFGELRPISVLSPVSKVLEKIMAKQIREHIVKYNILPERQSGFRPKYSCTTALLDVIDDILLDIDKGETTTLILLDYSKAFDKINHKLLIIILRHIGLSDSAINLIKSYLSNRMQMVKTTKGVSDVGQLHCGVPQGSVLGPLLFCIYTFNIVNCLKYCKSYQYADDTQLRYSFKMTNIQLANDLINRDLNQLIKLSEQHQLLINPDKSNIMVFGGNKVEVENTINIKINDTVLPCVRSARNLGLEIDTDLRFSNHITNCIKKAYINLKMLYPHRYVLSKENKIMLTDALVLSHFNFCDAVYSACLTIADQDRIQRVQKSCLRYIYGIKKYEPVSYKLKSAGWLTMKSRRLLHSCCLYQSIMLNKTPPYLYNKIKFRTDIHSLNLRFRGLISPPIYKKLIFTRSFSYNVYKLYNDLPTHLKTLKLTKFRNSYRRILMDIEAV